MCSLGEKPHLICNKSSVHDCQKKFNFQFIILQYLFPKAIFFVQEHFGKIKPSNNVTICEEGFVIVGFHTTHFYQTILYCENVCADTHCIQTFGNIFQNNSWVYIDFTIQFSCNSLPCPGKFSVEPNFFTMDYTIDLANWCEIVL